MRVYLPCALSLALIACESEETELDAGATDARVTSADASVLDAASLPDTGSHTHDAAQDAGFPSDAESPDAEHVHPQDASQILLDAEVPVDVGPIDAESPDTGVDAGSTVLLSGYVNTDLPDVSSSTVTITLPDQSVRHIILPADGHFLTDIPAGEPVFVQVDVPGYVSLIHGILETEHRGPRNFYPQSLQAIGGLAAFLGLSIDPGLGLFYIEFSGAPEAGYSAEIAAPHDPAVTVAGGLPQISPLTLAGSPDNWIAYPNVAVGTTTVSAPVVPAGRSCSPRADIRDWPVKSGVMTQFDFDCHL